MSRLAQGARRGFTLIELMVAVTIGMVLVAGGLAAYRGTGERQTLKQAGISFQTNLKMFQQKVLSGEKPADCGPADIYEGFEVSYVDTASYTATPICQEAMPAGRTYTLPEEVKFGAWSPTTIFFPVLKSVLTGAQTITLISGSFFYDVVIEPSGVIRGEMRATP